MARKQEEIVLDKNVTDEIRGDFLSQLNPTPHAE
jgi:hypothetical protein